MGLESKVSSRKSWSAILKVKASIVSHDESRALDSIMASSSLSSLHIPFTNSWIEQVKSMLRANGILPFESVLSGRGIVKVITPL